jgi:hypothetical protein
MPSLKIRPKSISRHGRQFVYDAYSRQVVFNIGKVRRIFDTIHVVKVCFVYQLYYMYSHIGSLHANNM